LKTSSSAKGNPIRMASIVRIVYLSVNISSNTLNVGAPTFFSDRALVLCPTLNVTAHNVFPMRSPKIFTAKFSPIPSMECRGSLPADGGSQAAATAMRYRQ